MSEKLLRVKDMIAILGISKTTLNRMINSNELPRHITISKRIKMWKAGDIEQFIEQKMKQGKTS